MLLGYSVSWSETASIITPALLSAVRGPRMREKLLKRRHEAVLYFEINRVINIYTLKWITSIRPLNFFLVYILRGLHYIRHMYDMTRKPAEWRKRLTPQERAELERAERVRDASSENLREITKKLKNRCVQRMRRAADDTEN